MNRSVSIGIVHFTGIPPTSLQPAKKQRKIGVKLGISNEIETNHYKSKKVVLFQVLSKDTFYVGAVESTWVYLRVKSTEWS